MYKIEFIKIPLSLTTRNVNFATRAMYNVHELAAEERERRQRETGKK